MAAPRYMAKHDLKQQYTFNVEVGGCGVLDMSRVYPKTLFWPMFYSWWNCPLSRALSEDLLDPDQSLVTTVCSKKSGKV